MKPSTIPYFAIFALVLSMMLPVASSAKIVYVKSDGSNLSTGLSWALAKSTVQAGLNTAVSGDEVWVAVGTYVERIVLKSGVKLYGGFSGDEVSRGNRSEVWDYSVLDGNYAGSVVTATSISSAVIDGFVIRHGSASDGGGISCLSTTNTVISNNMIVNNTATSYGGGISADSSSVNIVNNTIADNI